MLKGVLILTFCAVGCLNCSAQDTLRVMYYNLLNYPGESPERVGDLRQILGYSKPDILVVNELLNEEGAELILNEALNVWGVDNYEGAAFIDGPDTDNMLYFNSDLLGLAEQTQIPTGLRDISEYILYYKSPDLGPLSDTVFLYVYSLHLKAGSGHFNQRKEEALVMKYRLNTLPEGENILVGGDFNFYSGNESGCLAIRESGDITLYDPIESIGDWSGNGAYANIHTQSTRSAPLADGAGGGMDDRFDLIFTSEDVLNNENGITFIEGTYQALGQDGDRFDQTIDVPFNPIVPDSISNALYYMSDHLPVLMDLKLDYTASIKSHQKRKQSWYFDPSMGSINFNFTLTNGVFVLYDRSGSELYKKTNINGDKVVIPNHIKSGMFIWKMTDEHSIEQGKLVVH